MIFCLAMRVGAPEGAQPLGWTISLDEIIAKLRVIHAMPCRSVVLLVQLRFPAPEMLASGRRFTTFLA